MPISRFQLRTYPSKIFRRFSGLFWPLFNPNSGGYINIRILPPKFGSKEPKNRLKLFTGISSSLIFKATLLAFLLQMSHLSGRAFPPNERTKQIISNIPEKDREILDEFFRKLFFFYEFGYTLFGDKPVSFETFDLEQEQKPELFQTSSTGYKTWSRYANLFPSQKYLFLFFEDQVEGICEITLINKDGFVKAVEAHIDKFSEVFGPEISPEKLLTLVVERQSLYNTPMHHRADLIGILLGYGKINAELFQKRNELLMTGAGIRKKRTTPSHGYQSIEEELAALNKSLQSFSKEGRITLNYMRLPGFAADPGQEETIRLRKKYIKLRRLITERFVQENVLETIAEKLCASE